MAGHASLQLLQLLVIDTRCIVLQLVRRAIANSQFSRSINTRSYGPRGRQAGMAAQIRCAPAGYQAPHDGRVDDNAAAEMPHCSCHKKMRLQWLSIRA